MNKWFSLICLSLVLIACETNPTPKLDSTSDSAPKAKGPIDSINALIKSDPNNPDLYFQRAQEHYALHDLPSSLNDIGRALKLDSLNTDYYLFLSNLKMLSKQSRESKDALLKAYKINPKDIDVLLKLGELYMLVEDFKNSFKYLNEALAIDIHNGTAYRLRGFNYKYAGDTAKAVSSFQTAIEQDANDYDSYLQLGLLYSTVLDPLALDYYDNALSINPKSLEALYAKGLHLQTANKPRAALAEYNKIIALNPKYFNAHFNAGYVYLEYLRVYDSAAYYYSDALKHGPESYFQAMYNRGLAYERMGDYDKALADYKEVLSMNPQYDLAAMAISRIEEK